VAGTRKLGKPTDQRLAMLKTQTTDLILNGKIVTTEARAKELHNKVRNYLMEVIRTRMDKKIEKKER